MITKSDSNYTLEFNDYFIIFSSTGMKKMDSFLKLKKASKVLENFSYSSDNNNDWLSVNDIKPFKKYLIHFIK